MVHVAFAEEHLTSFGLTYAIIQSPANLLYCTGLRISQGTLLVKKGGSLLFVDGRYYELACQKNLPFEVVLLQQPNDLFLKLKNVFENVSGKIGFDAATMTVSMYEKIAPCCPTETLISAPSYYATLRRQKQPDEIQAITQACTLCEKGFEFLLGEIRPGVTEKALVSRLKSFWFEHGAEDFSFEPIIAFDQNTSIPHWSSSDHILKKQGTILIDIGVQLHNYHSDMTRMVFLGPPDEELEKCYSIVKSAYEKAFSFAAPGVTPHLLDTIARDHITSMGYGKFFVHGLGHGVGLEVHESPRLSTTAMHEAPLAIGDVFTIEPGIYLPGRGGVRLENTVVLEKRGAKSLFSLSNDAFFLP